MSEEITVMIGVTGGYFFFMHLHRRNEQCFSYGGGAFFSPPVRLRFCRGRLFSAQFCKKKIFLQKGLTFADGFGIIGVLSLLMLCMGEIQKEVY